MDRGMVIFLGALLTFTSSWLGLVFVPFAQLRGEQRTGADQKRSFGLRRTVSRDYIYDNPTMLGTMRTGPDLANIGVRNPSATWHHTHLLNPRSAVPWSIMPSFAFFYTREKVVGTRSDKALSLAREWTVDP